jgi:protocatechuate 3,4-dioxygenase beta subunit
MDRKKFLKGIGLIGVGAAFSPAVLAHRDEPSNQELLGGCSEIPGETTGPYPLPSSVSSSSMVRSAITEGTQTGIPLTLTLTIVNAENNCLPVSGLRVDIWHCNKRGYYSAYDGQPGIDGTVNNAGTTWLRGIQYTDSNGQVTFETIYPGWYSPRATHIHVEIYNGSTLLVTSQIAFPEDINTTVNNFYNTSGTNPVTNTTDMVFSDSYNAELVDVVTGNTTSGYIATKEIAVNAGTVGIEEFEIETGGQFGKLKCSPNPMSSQSIISFSLLQTSEVSLIISDLHGREVYKQTTQMTAGSNSFQISRNDLGSVSGTYLYELRVSNTKGTFRQIKKLVLV